MTSTPDVRAIPTTPNLGPTAAAAISTGTNSQQRARTPSTTSTNVLLLPGTKDVTSPYQQQQHPHQNQEKQKSGAAATSNLRDPSPDRECDEYRISPVTVSVSGPLSLKFPGSDFAEVSVPSLGADVLVIASLADSYANGECSLGIPRRFVKNAHLDRETGVVSFDVAQEAALNVATKLLWLVTGQSSHASPAADLVSRAAQALHAVAALKHDSKKKESDRAADFLNERRMSRRKLLQEKWEREEIMEKETVATRNQILFGSPTLSSPLSTKRSVSEIYNEGMSIVSPKKAVPTQQQQQQQAAAPQTDARQLYAQQLQDMLIKGMLGSPTSHRY
jgi:hypothetical protein